MPNSTVSLRTERQLPRRGLIRGTRALWAPYSPMEYRGVRADILMSTSPHPSQAMSPNNSRNQANSSSVSGRWHADSKHGFSVSDLEIERECHSSAQFLVIKPNQDDFANGTDCVSTSARYYYRTSACRFHSGRFSGFHIIITSSYLFVFFTPLPSPPPRSILTTFANNEDSRLPQTLQLKVHFPCLS